MKRLLALLGFLILTLAPTPAYAEDAEWEAEIPKGGGPILRCEGFAAAGGHSYKDVNWVFTDADEPADRENRWQHAYCDMTARRAVTRWFLWRHGITIDPATVQVTVRRL